MNLRNILILFVALVVAGFAAMMARGMLLEQMESMKPAPVVVQPKAEGPYVLVAKTAMAPGSFVHANALEWVAWPTESLSPTYVVKGKRGLDDFVGAVARASINAGDPIVDSRFVRAGDRGFLAAVLARGNRAVTVPISATSGNAGFVFPGDLVDVILTAKYSDNPDKSEDRNFYAATVLSAVRVLAIDQKTEYAKNDPSVGKTATLEVTPKQAEMIALSLQMGQLSLSLRSLGVEEAENGVGAPPSGESTAIANAEAPAAPVDKPKKDGDHSYVLDKELRFMLDGRGPAGREVTILRGAEEKKTSF